MHTEADYRAGVRVTGLNKDRKAFDYTAVYTGIPGHEIKSSRTAQAKHGEPVAKHDIREEA